MNLKSLLSLILLFLAASPLLAQQTKFEKSGGTETVTYAEGIAAFKALDAKYEELELIEYGLTDSGEPLHLMVASGDKIFDPQKLKDKTIVMVMNAIHPGEPDGVDASLLLLRDLMEDSEKRKLLDNVVLVVIPFYNIGGALNRNSISRANQNGPKAYGFRGNARNLDLNRDMVKAESRNAKSFMKMYHEWKPDVFIDNHVSNGADYQYVVTVIPTQEDKLGNGLGEYLRNEMMPALYADMKKKDFEMMPYVNVFGSAPDKGFSQFLETPRYSTGFTALFGSLSFVTETHMLKPYQQRVEGTYAFMLSNLEYAAANKDQIKRARSEYHKNVLKQEVMPIAWELDTAKWTELDFKGYEAERHKSAISNNDRLFYNREKPFEKKVKYLNSYKISKSVTKPFAYVIPQGWYDVVERMKLNDVEMSQLTADTTINVQSYYIKDFATVKNPYEGHYLHYNTEVEPKSQKISVRKGDYLIKCNQTANRYIVETLEPEATDSFFNWNFFDIILQQKEHFSAYVFEETAAKLLNENGKLRDTLKAEIAKHPEMEKNQYAQLNFIYEQAGFQEHGFMRYPIFRINEKMALPLKD